SAGLDQWIVHTLATTYYNGKEDIPLRLLREDLILPVIDGLDEIPESSRRSAIKAIHQTLDANSPIVATCRTVEYEELITGGAPRLRRAPVVEVSPVSVDDAITYLKSNNWPSGTSWDAVYNQLRTEPESPVGLAFSTPLMISMAATVYLRLGGDPGDLTDRAIFGSRHAVED